MVNIIISARLSSQLNYKHTWLQTNYWLCGPFQIRRFPRWLADKNRWSWSLSRNVHYWTDFHLIGPSELREFSTAIVASCNVIIGLMAKLMLHDLATGNSETVKHCSSKSMLTAPLHFSFVLFHCFLRPELTKCNSHARNHHSVVVRPHSARGLGSNPWTCMDIKHQVNPGSWIVCQEETLWELPFPFELFLAGAMARVVSTPLINPRHFTTRKPGGTPASLLYH
jgi:hypothetical protein